MSTRQYAMVRGSTIRVTGLSNRGAVNPIAIQYGVSKSVAKIDVAEVTESGSNELLRNTEEQPRIRIVQPERTIRYEASVDFLNCDPALLNIMAGVPMVENHLGDIVGFDANTRIPAKAFALEVWSKLDSCAVFDLEPPIGFGIGGFGQQPFGRTAERGQEWGYTLFPFLKGGTMSGFTFANGLVSFNLRRARCQRNGRWGVGPHDLSIRPYERLLDPVSRNTNWRTFVTLAQPPEPFSGITAVDDVIYGGSEGYSSPDTIYGGSGGSSSPWIIEGGGAA